MNEMMYFKTFVLRLAVTILTGAVITFPDVSLYVFVTFLRDVLVAFTFDIGIVDLLNIECSNLNDNLRDRNQFAYISDCALVSAYTLLDGRRKQPSGRLRLSKREGRLLRRLRHALRTSLRSVIRPTTSVLFLTSASKSTFVPVVADNPMVS